MGGTEQQQNKVAREKPHPLRRLPVFLNFLEENFSVCKAKTL
jgi:hypothetical protein